MSTPATVIVGGVAAGHFGTGLQVMANAPALVRMNVTVEHLPDAATFENVQIPVPVIVAVTTFPRLKSTTLFPVQLPIALTDSITCERLPKATPSKFLKSCVSVIGLFS
jgi:hypothetical protein